MNYKYIFLCILCCSCTHNEAPTHIYSVLFDRTDPLLAQPQAQEITSFIDSDNPNQNIHIRYAEISAVDYNPVTECYRPASQRGLLSNAVVEKKQSQTFTHEIQKLFAPKEDIDPAQHSSIFLPLVSEIQLLQSIPYADSRTLIVYSDLMENSTWLSYFRSADLSHLEQRPERLVNQYLKQAKEIRGARVSVHIVFIPRNNEENARYQQLQKVYTSVFTQLGIRITFSANLTQAHLTI